jgi:hypothetical protein
VPGIERIVGEHVTGDELEHGCRMLVPVWRPELVPLAFVDSGHRAPVAVGPWTPVDLERAPARSFAPTRAGRLCAVPQGRRRRVHGRCRRSAGVVLGHTSSNPGGGDADVAAGSAPCA